MHLVVFCIYYFILCLIEKDTINCVAEVTSKSKLIGALQHIYIGTYIDTYIHA